MFDIAGSISGGQNSLKNIINNYFGMSHHFLEVDIGGHTLGIDEILKFELSATTRGEASFCSVKCIASSENPTNDETFWDNTFRKISEGSTLKISGGYSSSSTGESHKTDIFSGFVYSCDLSIENRVPYFELFGMDGKIWLMNNRTIQFDINKKKFSELVKNILDRGHFSKVNVDISEPGSPGRLELYQNDESDFDYLVRLSEKIGCNFFVDRGTCNFVSVGTKVGKTLTIEPIGVVENEGVINKIDFKSNIIGVPKSVSSKFYLGEKFKESKICKVNNLTKIGSGKTADKVTSNVVGEIDVFGDIMDSEDYAKLIASGKYIQKSKHLSELEIVCRFIPDLYVGSTVSVKDFGKPVDNNYLLTSVQHKYDGKDFKTTIGLSSDTISR